MSPYRYHETISEAKSTLKKRNIDNPIFIIHGINEESRVRNVKMKNPRRAGI